MYVPEREIFSEKGIDLSEKYNATFTSRAFGSSTRWYCLISLMRLICEERVSFSVNALLLSRINFDFSSGEINFPYIRPLGERCSGIWSVENTAEVERKRMLGLVFEVALIAERSLDHVKAPKIL